MIFLGESGIVRMWCSVVVCFKADFYNKNNDDDAIARYYFFFFFFFLNVARKMHKA